MTEHEIMGLVELIDNKHTQRSYKSTWRNFFATHAIVSQSTVDSYIRQIKGNMAITSSTRRLRLNAVNFILSKLASRGQILDKATIGKSVRVYGKKYVPKQLRDSVAKYLQDSTKGKDRLSRYIYHRDIAINELLRHGLRRSEVASILNSNVHILRNELSITIVGKGDKVRNIYANDTLKMAIQGMIDELSLMSNLPKEHDHLILNEKLKPISDEGIRYLFTKWYGHDYSCHCLRATLATDLFESGMSDFNMLKWFGWSSTDTAQFYNLSVNSKFVEIKESIK